MVISFCNNKVKVSSMTAAENYVLSMGGSRFEWHGDEYTWWSLTGWTKRRMSSQQRTIEQSYTGWSKETTSFIMNKIA